MKKQILLLILLIPTLLLTACGAQSPAEETKPEASEQINDTAAADREDNSQPTVSSNEKVEPVPLSHSINALGYDLFAQFTQAGPENICFSPYSIESALGMAAAGASGDTLDEMRQVMQIGDMDSFIKDLSLSADKLENDAMDIRIANSAWYEKDLTFSDSFESEYLPLLRDAYKADCFEETLSDPATVQMMNEWIGDATNDKITDMVNEVPDDAVLLLFNAVYFNAEWALPFPKEGTYDEAFNGTNGEQTVPFMHLSEQYFKYYEYKGIRALRMYYKDSDMAMDLLIPADEDADVTALFNALSLEEKQALYDGLSEAEEISIASLKLPRFTFESDSIRLNEYLKNLGMVKAFTNAAEFDKISDEVRISDIFHKTYIRVDENGTEAAAVTQVMMNRMSLPAGNPVTFEVTMPFMYYISDTSDGTILFMGSMSHIDD